MKLVRHVPVAATGLALAILTLGNLLRPFGGGVRYSLGVLGGLLLAAVAFRALTDRAGARAQLRTPVALGVLPTSTMALMVVASYLRPYLPTLALVTWVVALVAQAGIITVFLRRYVLHPRLENVVPSWFVTFVGLAVVAITAPAFGAEALGQVLVRVAFAGYVVALVPNLVRLRRGPELPAPARPTLAIFTSPVSLVLAAYLASFADPSPAVVTGLLALAAASYLAVTLALPRLLRSAFSPAYAAFTFPYVISAVAFAGADTFLADRGITTALGPVALASKWVAVALVAYVLARYVLHVTTAARAAA